MTLDQVKALVNVVAQLCPAQRINEFTAEAWHLVLANVDAPSAIAAVKELARSHRFIAPSDILGAIAVASADPMERAVIPAPDADPDDPIAWLAAYRREVAKVRAQINAGTWVNPVEEVDPEGRARMAAIEAHIRERGLPSARGLEPAEPVSGADRPTGYRQARADLSGTGLDFWERRDRANTIGCRRATCRATVGQTCHFEGVPLRNSPAHLERLIDVGLEKEPVTPSAADLEVLMRLDGTTPPPPPAG